MFDTYRNKSFSCLFTASVRENGEWKNYGWDEAEKKLKMKLTILNY